MLKCKVCGQEFTAKSDCHYISRDGGKVGMVAMFQSNQEERIYDTFDCPACGCQCVVQERKRDFCPISISEIEDDDGHENVSGDEEKPDPAHHRTDREVATLEKRNVRRIENA